MNELQVIAGAKDQKFIATRLKWAGLLPTCCRCGGSGHYSYNAMTGTTCFGCHGAGVVMPKVTDKFVATVRKAFTAEVRVAYEAEMTSRSEAKARVKAIGKAIRQTPLELEYQRQNELAKAAGCKHWSDAGDWVEANAPAVYYAFIGHYEAADRIRFATGRLTIAKAKIEKVLNAVSDGKKFNKVTRTREAVNWLEVEAELAPLLAELEVAGQVPAAGDWKMEWRTWGNR